MTDEIRRPCHISRLQAVIKATPNFFTKNKNQEDEFRHLPTKQEPGRWTDFFKEYL